MTNNLFIPLGYNCDVKGTIRRLLNVPKINKIYEYSKI